MGWCEWLAWRLMVFKNAFVAPVTALDTGEQRVSFLRMVERGNGLPRSLGSYTRRVAYFLALLVGVFLWLIQHSWAQSVQVSMQITVDNRHRVFLGSISEVREMVATDWVEHWTGWQSVETYQFRASPGDYIYVVGQDDHGSAMMFSIVRFGDLVVYSGVPNDYANWEVASNYRPRYGDQPPSGIVVNGWIAEKKWEMPAVGAEAGNFYSNFSAYRPARYIWKWPGGSPGPGQAWGFPGGHTGPGTALFRIRVPGPHLRFDVTDAETGVSIGGVLLVLTSYDGSDQVAVETASDGIATVPIDRARFGKTYSLQIFPRRYYQRSDGSVVTYLTPAGGSGLTDIAIQIAEDGTYTTLIDKSPFRWGDVYWRLTTRYPANTKFAFRDGVIILPLSLIPVKLERIPNKTSAVQYSLDRLVQEVTRYNQQNTGSRVPPHIAYANSMLEVGGETGLAYTEFQGVYWTTVNNKGVSPYAHEHRYGLPNCTEEHTDSGYGYAQLTGLTALEWIRIVEVWITLLNDNILKNDSLYAKTKARVVSDLARLAEAGRNIYAMLSILNRKSILNRLNRHQLKAWENAIQNYNPGDAGRLDRAWRWLTSPPPQNGTIQWEIPIPSKKYQQPWDSSLKDEDFNGLIDELPGPPPGFEVINACR